MIRIRIIIITGESRVYVIVLVIGLGLITYGIYILSLRIRLVPMSKIIIGTVIDMNETRTSKGRIAYFPVIEYRDPETCSIESFQHDVGGGRSKYNIGDSLELRYYNDGDKKLVLINSWPGRWHAPF